MNSDVPVVILAGGKGARFSSETEVLPKPLIEVAGKPMLGHIMDLFEAQGFGKFYIAGGYKWGMVSDYLATRYECISTPHTDLHVFGQRGRPVSTFLIDTGLDATTGDRLMRFATEMFLGTTHFITYGDGLCDVDLNDLLVHHNKHRDPAGARDPSITVTAVHPPSRFGRIEFFDGEADGLIKSFDEKPAGDWLGWINGGFMVADAGAVMLNTPTSGYKELDEPCMSFETGALPRMASKMRLRAFRHEGYWHCIDTRRDLEQVEADVAANGGRLPWLRK